VDLTGSDWYQSGRFEIPQDPDFSATSGQRIPGASDINDSGDWTRSGKFLLRINEPKSAGFGLFTVLGEAKNEGGAIRMAFITATFSNAAGQILGSATGAVSQIEAGESKTFTLNSNDDLTASVQSRIQIDSAI
jgi:hypothetical protein